MLGALFPSVPSRQNPGCFYFFFLFNFLFWGASRLNEARDEKVVLDSSLASLRPQKQPLLLFADFGPFCCGAIIAVVLLHNNLFIYIPEATACLCLPPLWRMLR